jgi:hypothetical protein
MPDVAHLDALFGHKLAGEAPALASRFDIKRSKRRSKRSSKIEPCGSVRPEKQNSRFALEHAVRRLKQEVKSKNSIAASNRYSLRAVGSVEIPKIALTPPTILLKMANTKVVLNPNINGKRTIIQS